MNLFKGLKPYFVSIFFSLLLSAQASAREQMLDPKVELIPWRSVIEFKDCPYPLCPARDGFQINRDGQYFYGILEGTPIQQGIVESDEEFQDLLLAANSVTSEDLSMKPVCTSLEVLPGMSSVFVLIEFEDDSVTGIFLQDTELGLVCTRGNNVLAERLYLWVDQLATRYG